MTSVLILGVAKSGTSALYSSAKQQLPDALTVFEPSKQYQLSYIENSDAKNKVVKILYPALDVENTDISFFDKKILIVRDPRDCLVSMLLYKPFLSQRYLNTPFINDFIEMLKAKEKNPDKVSILDIVEVMTKHEYFFKSAREYRKDMEKAIALRDKYPDIYLLKFEDYVSGQTAELNEFTGLKLGADVEVSAHVKYNARAKKAGGWRNWFTEADVEHFRPMMLKYMDYFGYEDEWELSQNPEVKPEHSSLYIERYVEQLKRMPNQFGTLRELEQYTPEYLQHLKSAAAEGAEGAMIELGLANLFGYTQAEDNGAYQEWMQRAYERRNPHALIHWGVGIERGLVKSDIDPKSLFSESGQMIGNASSKRTITRVRDLYAGLGAG